MPSQILPQEYDEDFDDDIESSSGASVEGVGVGGVRDEGVTASTGSPALDLVAIMTAIDAENQSVGAVAHRGQGTHNTASLHR